MNELIVARLLVIRSQELTTGSSFARMLWMTDWVTSKEGDCSSLALLANSSIISNSFIEIIFSQ
jgi:hypothetical protein